MTEEERCAEARKFEGLDDAFRRGDLAGLRAALDDPAAAPNGLMPDTIGSCLVYAVYHSPMEFIRELLEIGADPNAPVDDGFPPLIAALSCTRETPGANRRQDMDEVLRLLLSRGADPNQRGINDYTPLHMAVAESNALAVQVLLDAGADPELRTRIDDCETPLELARAASQEVIAAILDRKGAPLGQRLRSGITLLLDVPGAGEPVRGQHSYAIRLRLRLRDGTPVRWPQPWGPVGASRLGDDGRTLYTEILLNRGRLVNGLFYGIDGMRVGGTRRLELAPHMAYGDRGVPGVIPPGAALFAEITILNAA